MKTIVLPNNVLYVVCIALIGFFLDLIVLNSKIDADSLLQKNTNEDNMLVLSPACIPFWYNKTRNVKNNTKNHKKVDYYEEFWSEKNIKRPTIISFLHMRKAGGSTLYNYFKNVVKSNKTSFRELHHCEGSKSCLELNHYEDGYHRYYDDERNTTDLPPHKNSGSMKTWDTSGSTFYVTHLREPVARALSMYKYDLRFKCPLLMEKRDRNNTQAESMTVENFTNQLYFGKEYRLKASGRHGLWDCNSNCYARWVTGMYYPMQMLQNLQMNASKLNTLYPSISDFYYDNRQRDDNSKNGKDNKNDNNHKNANKFNRFGQVLSEEALKLLLRYDLIIVIEWLKDKEYAKLIEDIFFAGFPGLDKQVHPYCGKLMKGLNDLHPLEVDNSTLKQLHKLNDIDENLIRTLLTCS